MRAVVLSNSTVVKLLNKHYVSVFLLLRDLPELQNGVKGEQARQLATLVSDTYEAAIEQGADHSVNTFVVSPELELIGHLSNQLQDNPDEKYATFLKDSLAEVKKH